MVWNLLKLWSVGIAEAIEHWNTKAMGCWECCSIIWVLLEAMIVRIVEAMPFRYCQNNAVARLAKASSFWDCKAMGSLGSGSGRVLGLPKQLIQEARGYGSCQNNEALGLTETGCLLGS